ncbi:hypothetical protein MKK88_10620 [Methylobacterium sp. E-005]|nr:hypothetical protein [Methylobacterium sp. E-005]MCJ2086442.1 hypothetical protein [Methylobacterium sp. E-005]
MLDISSAKSPVPGAPHNPHLWNMANCICVLTMDAVQQAKSVGVDAP